MEGESKKGDGQEFRVYLNCGFVIQGPATVIDEILKNLNEREDIKLVYKTVSLKNLWIKEGDVK
jgi:sRNA-binding regulator protein Hfq